ncbi:MAG TPA: hypothetical protein VLE99_04960 [Candidatus Saccharimonadales bacterium]|nr:hypothetical protein [Candidatus Saccharimonadales bacterium]
MTNPPAQSTTSFWSYTLSQERKKFITYTLLLVIASALLTMWAIQYNTGSSPNKLGGRPQAWVIVLPAVLYGVWLTGCRRRFADLTLRSFAAAKGYQFTAQDNYGASYGLPDYKIKNDSPQISDVVTGTLDRTPFRLCRYKIPYGQSYAYGTLLDLTVSRQLPPALFAGPTRHRGYLTLVRDYGGPHQVSLSNAPKGFVLYAPEDSDEAARAIFSTDTLSFMQQAFSNYTIRTAPGHMYIYVKERSPSQKSLDQLFALATQLLG